MAIVEPGLRPEHSETKAKTETRECETETSPVKPIACESNTNRYVLFFLYYTHEANDEPELDFTFKMISK